MLVHYTNHGGYSFTIYIAYMDPMGIVNNKITMVIVMLHGKIL